MHDPKRFLLSLFDAALSAADPLQCVPPHLPVEPGRRTVLVGAGKASALMAQAIEKAWPHALEGLVVTRYGHAVPCERVEIVEAAHPVPDAAGEDAARRILDLAESLGEGDLLICAISGGGSSLLSLPAPGLTLADKQAVNKALLRSGAAIGEMNCLRKHLSAVKGGRLARAAYPARVHTILISDVPGDDPAVIASGPTVPDGTSLADARDILDRRGIDVPQAVRDALSDPANETPKPGDPVFAKCTSVMAARPLASLQAAADLARKVGIMPLILGDALEGESREVAQVMAGIARSIREHGLPVPAPCLLLSGGETTVTIRGEGTGGPNAEFALALAVALQGLDGVHAVACDTDGVDGAAEVAGAVIGPDTLAKALARGIDPRKALADNDAHGFFAALGDQIVPGPTLTNVNDFRAVLVS
ncbi:glycerate kinase [Rhodospirillaceae bacterium KN72]|uniref:Glycerate kinase n=1 Tax=Pacificispira spongiicola TaxID=2729598 RepID=A0A7Y0HFY6_9PROT|nr:glycerate kinase [Pacificispira spongiicola]NMM45098.1 glycerate kinase [Pacificispira spongiicola]